MGEYYRDSHRYDDIIDLPHHTSTRRTPMSLHDRAAQFAAFAALTGHEEALSETARLTTERIVLSEEERTHINEQLYRLSLQKETPTSVAVTYFKKDQKKAGGAYPTDIGSVKKLDETTKSLILDNGVRIPMEDISAIEFPDA